MTTIQEKYTGLSVVVPAYNSAQSLPLLAEALQETLATLTPQFELILVNDASRDNTWQVIETLAAQHAWIYGINMMRNYGQHSALLCGIRAAKYPIVITMDDDLEHPPAEIPKLLHKLAEGYDVVYGKPEQQQHGLWRDLASEVTKFALQTAMRAEIARSASAFRVMRTQVRDAFANYDSPYLTLDVLLTWGTTRFAAITVRHDPRRFGTSNYTFKKLVVHAINMLTGFSVLPLQIASFIGFAFTLLGILVFAFVLVRYIIEGGSVPGFPFLASIIAIFSGAQLFALGIIGEYLARIHFRTMNRPAYTVRETTDVRLAQAVPVSTSAQAIEYQ